LNVEAEKSAATGLMNLKQKLTLTVPIDPATI
jgi:hypothetical protein